MSSFLSSLLAFIVAISVLVAVHEYGHYIVGRWMGMKVLRFSIGFGKPIWTRVSGPDKTEYCISSIPLGGYVRFLDTREGAVAPEDQGRAFNQRPIPARIAVLLAGPAFNFLFALVAYWGLFVYGVPTLVPAVAEVQPGSYAEEAGLEANDRIVAVGTAPSPDWQSTLIAMLDEMVSDGRIPLTVESADGRQRNVVIDVGDDATRLTEPNMLFEGLGFRPRNTFDRPAEVARIVPGGAAEGSPLLPGDRIVAIDDVEIPNFGTLVQTVGSRPGETVALTYERDGIPATIDFTIGAVTIEDQVIGRLGIETPPLSREYYYNRQYSVLASVGESIERTWRSTVFTVTMLGRMITGDVSWKGISGPIGIAQFAGSSAEKGLDYFIDFLAIVSISLGVLNLLPVPVLDGGQIVYQTIEGLKGRPLSERAQIIGQQIGILALLLLMSLAFFNDLTGLFGQSP